ncbi:MAG: alpha-amylase [Verrucomicrobiota bacterium JB023]|nr:alpha-amylase [Verrucomicrobiota bacterium JB023]
MKGFIKNLLKALNVPEGEDETPSPPPASAKAAGIRPEPVPETPSAEEPASPEQPAPAPAPVRGLKPAKPSDQTLPTAPAPLPTKGGNTPDSPVLTLFFEVHQPNRLKPYNFFDIGNDPFYEDDDLNRKILDKVSERCYLPANALFTRLLEEHAGQFRMAMSLSGVFIEQLEHHRPDVLESFKKLHATGHLELLSETYYHSMGYHRSKDDFTEQVALHKAKLKEHFGVKPSLFRHTEQVYFNEFAAHIERLKFKGMMAEGVAQHLNGRSPNHLYRSPNVKSMPVILRNGQLSDDIGFRFADTSWDQWPLTAETYAAWCAASGGDVLNIALDYETIGEHQGAETGIFDFWEEFPRLWLESGHRFATPSEVVDELKPVGIYDCHEPTSWADAEKDLSPWKGNAMQLEARKKILLIEQAVKDHDDAELLHQWRKMQTSDHFYYMSTKGGAAGQVHDYFRPYASAYDAYLYYMNALSDLQLRVESGEEPVREEIAPDPNYG